MPKTGILPSRDGEPQAVIGPTADGFVQIDICGQTFRLDKETALRMIGELAATLECIEAGK